MTLNDVIKNLKSNNTNYIEYYKGAKKMKKPYSEVYGDVQNAVGNLKAMGINTGDKIGIVGKNAYEWVVIDLACICYGVITVPIDINQFKTGEEWIAEYELRCIFTNLKDFVNEQAQIFSFEILQNHTRSNILEFEPHFFEPDSIFTVVFTSGTHGKQKAIEVRVKSFDDFITESQKMYPVGHDDKILVFLPLNVYIERCYIYGAILSGFNAIVVPLEYVVQSIMKDSPTIVVGVPYFFETFAELFMKKIKSNLVYFFLFTLYLFLKRIGLGFILPRQFILFKMAWGGKIRYLMTGSAPCNRKVLQFYKDMGIILYEGYGMSELGGMVALNYPGHFKLGSVGKPFPNKEIFFDEQGQVFVKCSYSANDHYYKAVEADSNTYLPDGVVATGDIGYIDKDGYLYLKGRVKETIVLSNGNKVHPVYIENMLLESELIKNCLIFGDNCAYITALIVPKDKSVSIDKIDEVIERVNAILPKHEKIVRYFLSYEPFTVENKMLTSALKTNRKFIYEKFSNNFKELYE